MLVAKENTIQLPSTLRGRSLHTNIIPTVCNLRNLLQKLIEVRGDYNQLKQWEKRSYQSYKIDQIKSELLLATPEKQIDIIRQLILKNHPTELGPSCINIYLVAFVAENYGSGKKTFFEYIKTSGISDKENSAQAIWQVGKGDGVFLNILNEDGTVKDWNFVAQWVKGDRNTSNYKSKEYFFNQFKTDKARQIAKEIDHYINKESYYRDDVEDSHESQGKERTDCIGYKSKSGPFKFATLTEARKVCFVLHLGKKLHTHRAKELQEEIDQLLGRKYAESDNTVLTPGEVYVRLEWVENLDQIKTYIDEAFVLRLRK